MSDEIYEHGMREGMEIAARARCSNCAHGHELYYGHPRRGGGFGLEWRHEAHHCQCGSWQVWDEMVRRGLLPTPEGWEPGPSHRVPVGGVPSRKDPVEV